MTTIVAVGYISGMIIAADSQVNKKRISTGEVIERSVGHQKVFPLPNLPIVIAEGGMEMTGTSSIEIRLNNIRDAIMQSLKKKNNISELPTEEIEEIFISLTISAYQNFCTHRVIPSTYPKLHHSVIFFSDTKRKNGFVLIMFPGHTIIARNELSSLMMGHVHADPRMQELDRKHGKHFTRRKRGEAINVAKTLVAKGIEIDEESGGNIQMVELTPRGWRWLAKP
jgi:hypothetical protein